MTQPHHTTGIAHTVSGSGDAVVAIHCSSSSGKAWASLVETIGEAFRVIAPDQWGCGASDPWAGCGVFTLADEARPIIELIEQVGMPVDLVGHSYGGGVALRIARERPELIRSLVLIEPSSFHLLRQGDAEAQTWFQEISEVADSVTQAVATGHYWAGMQRFVDYWSGEGNWASMSHEARLKMSQRLTKIVLDFRALFEEPATLDDYRALPFPTLIVCGERSPGPSRHIVDMLAEVMADTRVERIAGAGHMSPLTHAGAVNATIEEHLRNMSHVGQELVIAA